MKSLDIKATAVVIAMISFAVAGHAEQQTVVKKSASGICHCPGGQFYERTSNFTAFETLDDCLASGGREPKRGQGRCPPASPDDAATPADPPGSNATAADHRSTSSHPVRRSPSGICHCPGGQFYERTTTFTPFDTIEDCIGSGGREPKRGQGQCGAAVPAARTDGATPYDRNLFGGWSDDDNDCLTTRHEILLVRSATDVELSPDGCRVARGLWRDPYTDTEFTAAAELDIDHLVPLRYAWDRGASRWPEDKRREFANDPANVLPVAAAVNGSKGASGPLDWLPPSSDFACEYLLRFDRVVARYGLDVPPDELAGLDRLTSEHCD